jgi:SNF2 family DNA or RNA helicase
VNKVYLLSESSCIINPQKDEILEELHRKVKPFILRRDKMSVLSELPPKVIQDYYCHMTDIQVL